MDFIWEESTLNFNKTSKKDIEESFEDPFAIKIFPDLNDDSKSRYFLLGKSISDLYLFSVFWTNGKNYKVIVSREMEQSEKSFYEIKKNDSIQ